MRKSIREIHLSISIYLEIFVSKSSAQFEELSSNLGIPNQALTVILVVIIVPYRKTEIFPMELGRNFLKAQVSLVKLTYKSHCEQFVLPDTTNR